MSKIDNPPTAVTDHGALTGLTDDDHTQYPLLAGRSGGQTLIGGTGTTDDLILRSTAGVGAAGADIIFQVGNNGATEAMRILNSGNVGIGTASPTVKLDVAGTVEVKNGATPQVLNIYNTYTDASNYARIGYSSTGISGAIAGTGAYSIFAIDPGDQQTLIKRNGATLITVAGGAAGVQINKLTSTTNTLTLGAKVIAGLNGDGIYITAGTATSDLQALSITQTWNAAGTLFTGVKTNITNTASAANSLIQDWQVGGASKLVVTKDGNVGIGTTTPGGGTTVGTAILSLANGTAPVGGVANQVSLYSADVAASAELFALDEAGNIPQLSPHPTDLLNSLPISATGPYAYPWAYSASNAYLGKKIQVDLAGLVAAVEQLTGKQFAFVTDLPPAERADWDTGQEAQRVRRQVEIYNANQRRVDLDAQIVAEPDADKKAELIKQRDAIMPPVRYIKKRPPKWMRDRGVTTTVESIS